MSERATASPTYLGADKAARDAAIAALEVSITARQRAAALLNASAEGDVFGAEMVQATKLVSDAFVQYQESLPRVPISRCPFTGEVVRLAIDTFGLDGPWWSAEVPARPEEALPPTVFAVTGAVAFDDDDVPQTPFVCWPGPGVPYVVPRLLVHPQVRAVVSWLRIGAHDAYAIFYFSEDPPLDVYRVNTWGLDRYVAVAGSGAPYTAEVLESEIDYEFDLSFYVRSGRLLWIAPGDNSLLLRTVVRGCPYIGLAGRRFPAGIFDGKMWSMFPSMPDAEARGTRAS